MGPRARWGRSELGGMTAQCGSEPTKFFLEKIAPGGLPEAPPQSRVSGPDNSGPSQGFMRCAQFCAYHQTLLGATECRSARGRSRNPVTWQQFVSLGDVRCNLLILRTRRIRGHTLYPTELRARRRIPDFTVRCVTWQSIRNFNQPLVP